MPRRFCTLRSAAPASGVGRSGSAGKLSVGPGGRRDHVGHGSAARYSERGAARDFGLVPEPVAKAVRKAVWSPKRGLKRWLCFCKRLSNSVSSTLFPPPSHSPDEVGGGGWFGGDTERPRASGWRVRSARSWAGSAESTRASWATSSTGCWAAERAWKEASHPRRIPGRGPARRPREGVPDRSGGPFRTPRPSNPPFCVDRNRTCP